MQTENSIKPNKFEISKHQNGKCTVLFYDNIIEDKVTDPDGVETTRYLYYMYEVEVNSRDTLAESIEANYDEWLKFAKEENAKRVVAIPDVERIAILEQAVKDIGEVIGNDNFYVIQIRDLKTMTIEDVPKLWRKKVKEKLEEESR